MIYDKYEDDFKNDKTKGIYFYKVGNKYEWNL